MNKIELVGSLCSDIDVKTTQGGTNVASFRIAVRRPYRNKSTGQYECDFFLCKAFNSSAEYVQKYAANKDKIAVSGSIHMTTFTKKDGSKGYATEVSCDSVELIRTKAAGDAPGQFVEVEDDDDLPFD